MLVSILPGWQSLHPMIIHFPIVLLLVAPLFIVIGAVLPKGKGHSFEISALILLGLGTASLFLAIPTGDAAATHLNSIGPAQMLIDSHESLAVEARNIFVMLTVLYVAILIIPRILHRDGRLFSTVLPVAFLLLYCAGAVVLITAAHRGAVVASEYGHHAAAPAVRADSTSLRTFGN